MHPPRFFETRHFVSTRVLGLCTDARVRVHVRKSTPGKPLVHAEKSDLHVSQADFLLDLVHTARADACLTCRVTWLPGCSGGGRRGGGWYGWRRDDGRRDGRRCGRARHGRYGRLVSGQRAIATSFGIGNFLNNKFMYSELSSRRSRLSTVYY